MADLETTSSLSQNLTYLSGPKDLVRMSAVQSSVGQHYRATDLYCTSRPM
jgi:hypothetical protein